MFNDDFKKPFNPAFADSLLMEGIQKKHLSSINDQEINFVALSKLAMDFSDGVIQSSETVNNELLDYITEKQTNFLPYINSEDYVDEYLRFYDSL